MGNTANSHCKRSHRGPRHHPSRRRRSPQGIGLIARRANLLSLYSLVLPLGEFLNQIEESKKWHESLQFSDELDKMLDLVMVGCFDKNECKRFLGSREALRLEEELESMEEVVNKAVRDGGKDSVLGFGFEVVSDDCYTERVGKS